MAKYTSTGIKDAANATQNIYALSALGQGLAAESAAVVLASDQSAIPTGSVTKSVAASQMARPADTTAYAVGDLVANSTTAGSVAALAFAVNRSGTTGLGGMIRRAKLKTSNTSLTSASFRLHLYSAAPTVTNGDNGAWLSAGAANYLGSVDFTLARAFSDGATGISTVLEGQEINFTTDNVYGLLEARDTYTPASAQTFDVSLEVLQN